MPLVNVFLWIVLILTALLIYQLLVDYEYARQAARKQYARLRYENNHRSMCTDNRIVYAIKQKTSTGFLDVGSESALVANGECLVAYFQPVAASRTNVHETKEEAAGSGCHICA